MFEYHHPVLILLFPPIDAREVDCQLSLDLVLQFLKIVLMTIESIEWRGRVASYSIKHFYHTSKFDYT